ncbi:hypothetical protein [Nannocystis bainbridge]|uniref:Uncharacterized protein n=1 Tax=Nannocystis bainbridge TaxID=2995303 RepID=A0ABT5E1C1_9BACT|nr:hypothetical protein [Nannocystis bainbridge]MDC0719124.1 hypothetical protein [Nannocystis bainbridge]
MMGPTVVQAEPLVWPTRGEALPPDTYITTSGHAFTTNAIDFSALRWDASAGQYSIWRADATSPLTVDDHAAFGTALFAPEDGFVVACFHNHPDSQDPTVNQCPGGNCPAGLNEGGNFIMIVGADGDHAVTLAHLQEDSIPPGLCPNASTPPVANAGSCSISGMDAIRDEFRLDIQNPGQPYPLVFKGDLVGRLGHNGNSTGPHTHVHWKPFAFDGSDNPCEGDSEPIEWFEGYRQSRTPGVAPTSTWTQMDGHEVVDGVSLLVWPDPVGWAFSPLAYGHDASNLHLYSYGAGGVGAYQDATGNLDIRTWTVSTAGVVTDQDLREEGAVLDVALAGPMSSRDVIAVIRGSNGDLKLIPYDVDSSGNITRLTGQEEDGGAVSQVAAVKSPTHMGVVVAVRDGSGNLEVIDYTSDISLNLTKEVDEGSGGAIRDMAITSVQVEFQGVVTAELKQSNGELIVRSFDVPTGGGVFAADDFASGVLATAVDIDTVPVGLGEQVVTSVQLASGVLRLDTWEVDVAGTIVHNETISTDGTVSAHSGTHGGNGDFLTAVVDSTDHARLISWQVASDGQLRRSGTRLGRETTALAVMRANDSVGHVTLLYTDENDALNLRVYDRNYDSNL